MIYETLPVYLTRYAPLSLKDRAAGSVIVLANWETIFYKHYRSIFNHCDIIGRKIYRIRWENAK